MLIFLDFDGCLHALFETPGEPHTARFYYVPQFEKAVREHANLEIVISSSWRREHSLDAIRSFFSSDIAARIIGATPLVGSGSGLGARQREVEAWLVAAGRENEPWIAVDDFVELFEPGAAVVACQDQFGDRETALFHEAVANPAAFAQRYPVPEPWNEKRIIVVRSAQP